MDRCGPALHAGGMGHAHRRHRARRLVGLHGTRLGRLLGMGPGGKRLPHPVAHRYGGPAHHAHPDAPQQAARRERLPDGAHHHLGLLRHLPRPQRRGAVRACLRLRRRGRPSAPLHPHLRRPLLLDRPARAAFRHGRTGRDRKPRRVPYPDLVAPAGAFADHPYRHHVARVQRLLERDRHGPRPRRRPRRGRA